MSLFPASTRWPIDRVLFWVAFVLVVFIIATALGCCSECGGPAYLTRAYDQPDEPIVVKYKHSPEWWRVSQKDVELERRIERLEAKP